MTGVRELNEVALRRLRAVQVICLMINQVYILIFYIIL